jgi:hypothetical protein
VDGVQKMTDSEFEIAKRKLSREINSLKKKALIQASLIEKLSVKDEIKRANEMLRQIMLNRYEDV